jgi:hypothetical protein
MKSALYRPASISRANVKGPNPHVRFKVKLLEYTHRRPQRDQQRLTFASRAVPAASLQELFSIDYIRVVMFLLVHHHHR